MLNQIEHKGSDKNYEQNAENLISELNHCYHHLSDFLSEEAAHAKKEKIDKNQTVQEKFEEVHLNENVSPEDKITLSFSFIFHFHPQTKKILANKKKK